MKTSNFVTDHDLWSKDQYESAKNIIQSLKENNINTVRVDFADQHGILRGKTFTTKAFEEVLSDGCRITTTLLLKDTSHRTAFPIWKGDAGLKMSGMSGGGDFILVPIPETFQILPWTDNSAWVQCDAYLDDGTPVPFSTRHILRKALSALSNKGYDFLSGIELEFSVYKLDDPRLNHLDCSQPAVPPVVSPLAHGYNYLTENRYDELDPVMELLRTTLSQLDMPLRTLESEFGPSQFELTFEPVEGCKGADNVVLIRSAIKQVCRRHGYHATFMCRPNLPNAFSSGWHLHQSLLDNKSSNNVFVSNNNEILSTVGSNYLAGLLKFANEACIFTTPTINGYKRYRPISLAPTRNVWGRDNRGAMIRVIGKPGDKSTHLENRIGESAANPYLYFSSQIISGLEGIEQGLVPPEAVDTPYDENLPRFPKNLYEAIKSLRKSDFFRNALGDDFVDYYLTIKEFELNRFLSEEVTDWEHKEYFEIF